MDFLSGLAAITGRVKALWERFGLLAILAFAGLLHLQFARRFLSLTFLRDEAGYLSNAAALAGYTYDGASAYRAGYSLLIFPFYLVLRDPYTIYRCVQALNIALSLLAVVLLYRLISELFPAERRWKILLAVFVASLYPAWTAFSTFALSENLYVPLFVLSTLLCLRTARVGGWAWIAWGACVGFIDVVHPKGVVVIGAGLAVGAFIALQRREWKFFAAFVAAITLFVALNSAWLQPWVVHRLTMGEFPPDLRYPTLAHLLEPLQSLAGIRAVAIHLAAHIAYLLMGTLWLAWFGTLYAARTVNAGRREPAVRPAAMVLAYLVLCVLGTVGLSSLYFSSYPHALQLDQWMYGRYAEGTLLPLLGIGFITIRRFTLLPGILLALALAWIFQNMAEIGPTNSLNVSALWQSLFLYDWSIVAWCAVAGVIAVVVTLLPWDVLRAGALGTVFMFSIVMLYGRNLSINHTTYATRHRIADTIRSQYDPRVTKCVGFEPSPVANVERDGEFPKNATHLFEYGIRRTTFEQWASQCDGPLISWSRDLDRTHPDVPIHLAAFEERARFTGEDGPFLWTREPASWFTLPVGIMLSLTGPPGPLDHVLGNGWYPRESKGAWSTEKAELWLPIGTGCADGNGCDLMLRFATLPPREGESKFVDVRVDGLAPVRWTITSPSAEWHTLELGRITAAQSGLRISLSIPGATSPKDLGHSSDGRTLGIWLTELAIRVRAPDQVSSSVNLR